MLDRESTFANPIVVEFLKQQAIPVAIDQAYQRRQQDAEGEFYRKIVEQSPRKKANGATTQGLYLSAADGTFLDFTNNRDPDNVIRMLNNGMQRHRFRKTAPVDRGTADRRFNPDAPADGLIVRVQAKILGGYPEPETQFDQIFQSSVSRDNLWVTQSEHRDLAQGVFPDALAVRIARFHLVDNTRGEPPMWKLDEVDSHEFKIRNNVVTGHVQLKTVSGDRSYTVDLRGELTVEGGIVKQWDMVAKGIFSGDGLFTRGGPPEPFPLAISFTLADGTDMADSIPPQGSRGWIDGYLR